jgi:hypothetical protein
MRRHRVLSRQSGGLKRKNPGPSRRSLLRLIFSPGKCRLSIGCAGGSLLSSRASSTYKGTGKPEFQKIDRIKAAPLSGSCSSFFTVPIRNAHTRAAYYRAIQQFPARSERASYEHLEDIEPITVAAYMGSTPSRRHFVAPIDRIAARSQFYLLTLMR